jgi:hypothetical protein
VREKEILLTSLVQEWVRCQALEAAHVGGVPIVAHIH